MKNITVEELVRIYALKPHPEGGFYRETYRSRTTANGRSICTAIHFLLPAGGKSRLHRLASDEIWHFYLGGSITVAQLLPDGREVKTVLGPDPRAGQAQQLVVPSGCWFGAYPEPGTRYALVGCTVSPGFDFDDFEIGDRVDLLKRYPASRELIQRLT